MSSISHDHILIIGEMGAGKTTIGEAVASSLNMPFRDSDAALEAREGESGSSIAARLGVDRLHELELEVFLEMAAEELRSVIAPAASVIDSERGREVIGHHFAVWLDADDDILVERQRRGSHRRLVHAVERGRLRERRGRHYARLSEVRVDTGGQAIEDSVAQILDAVNGAQDTDSEKIS